MIHPWLSQLFLRWMRLCLRAFQRNQTSKIKTEPRVGYFLSSTDIAHASFRPQTQVDVQKIVVLASSPITKAEWNLVLELFYVWPWTLPVIRTFRDNFVR